MYKKMYNKLVVGGPETSLGTAVARTDRLPITDMVEIIKKAARTPSQVLTGRGTVRANFIDSIDLSMTIPLELQAIKAIGLLLVSNIGADLATPVQILGAVRIAYTGASASCKIVVANVSEGAKSITSTVGALGAEAVDDDFGVSGVLDLTAATNDTLLELKTVVDAYANYSCEILCGANAGSTIDPLAIAAAQASGNSVIIYFKSADSGVYLHRFVPVLANTERPVLSFQGDGTGLTNDVLAGAVVDAITISADLKGRAGMSATVIGTAATTAEATAVALGVKKPLKFSGASFFLSGIKQVFVKSFSATVANNHDADDGFGAGSLYKQSHAKGAFAATGSMTLRSTTTTEVEYAKRITELTSAMLAIFQGDDLVTSIPEMIAVRIPHIEVMDATKSGGGVGIDTQLTWEAVDPQSYDDVLTVDMLSADSTKYN